MKLYPFIKHKEVENGKTVRDILLSFSNNKTRLAKIEETLPLLNIYVPDMRLFGNFNVENWDVNDNEIAVSYLEQSGNTSFFGNGDSIFSLPPDEISGFPVLFVKITEKDESEEITNEYSYGSEYTIKAGAEGSTTFGKYGVKASLNFERKKTEMTKSTIKTTKDSDDLGTLSFRIYDPIILSDSEKYSKGYLMNTATTGAIEIMFLPM